MTHYNRYAYGPSTSISSLNSGNMNDWMLGGPAGVSANGTPTGTGSGKNTMAWTPENGNFDEGGFWPNPSNYVIIAKRAMRANFLAAYFSGKYAKLHDLNQSDVNATLGTLRFGVENLGQTPSDFQVSVTPISSNILTVDPPFNLTGMTVLEQSEANFNYTLDASIQPYDTIEFAVSLSNDYATDNVLYTQTIRKIYQPAVLLHDDPDIDGFNNWSGTGGTWSTTTDAYSGIRAITSHLNAPYTSYESKTLELNSSLDFSNAEQVLIQYYAKWDLERSFDYAQLEGSTDGSFWTPLCGKLTKPGAPDGNNTYSGKSSLSNAFQPDGISLYDGDTQDKWNLEEIVVDDQNNSFLSGASTVFLRFILETDGSNYQDAYYNVDFEGFTFDDFKCIQVKGTTSGLAKTEQNNIQIYPNPTLGHFSIYGVHDFFDLSIYNSKGQEVYRKEKANSNETVHTHAFETGVYMVKIESKETVHWSKLLIHTEQ